MNIYVIRHVETEGNVTRSFNGITESDFTDYGLYMKNLLEEDIKKADNYEHFDKIYTSPIKRAKVIADEIGETLKIEVETVPELKEFNFGIFDGKLPKEVEEEYPEIFKAWINDHLYYRIPEGDSFIEKYVEVRAWLKEILKSGDESIILVTHGATARCVLAYLIDISLEASWHFDIPLGGYCKIKYENDYGVLQALTTPDYENNESADFIKAFNK